MKKIENSEYYQITGTIEADFGQTITNPIIKIDTDAKGATKTGVLNCDYNIYISEEKYNEGKFFFKAEIGGERVSIIQYLVSNVPTFGFNSYKEEQRKIIADTFGLDISNVALVEEVSE